MKNIWHFATILSLALLFACGGGSNKTDNTKQTEDKPKQVTEEIKTPKGSKASTEVQEQNGPIILHGDSKEHLKAYYKLEHLKEMYNWDNRYTSELPPFELPQDLSKLSYEELRLLRNTIFARNGYLFNDGFLRGYFNRFKWYRPIFDVDSFKVVLNKDEQSILDTLIAEGNKRKKNKTIEVNGLNLFNPDLIVNKQQFEEVPETYLNDFKKQNFTIIPADRSMPFYAYDENAYQFIPHYITTDLYLFILHKYFGSSLEKLDAQFMYPQLKSILKTVHQELDKTANSTNDQTHLDAIDWAKAYSSIALYIAGDTTITIPEAYKEAFENEKKAIKKLDGKPSFIKNELLNYNELTPRGHYTKSEKLKKYFKCFKWISLNGININDKKQLKGFIAFALALTQDEENYRAYTKYISAIEKLAGQEDNLSMKDLPALIKGKTIEEVLEDETLTEIISQLSGLDKEKIKLVLGKDFKTEERDIKRLYFLSSTYSISGDIFSKLVHVNGLNSKRPFPKGLDLAAVFNKPSAKNILINDYQEGKKWQEYPSKLAELQQKFKDHSTWDNNYGEKAVQTALSAASEEENYPDFMKTDAYNRKELSTLLASWTHVKHDLILYQEKPHAAEAGQGGGPEPPKHISYVEPNLKFWASALELVNWLEGLTELESSFKNQLRTIKKLGELLQAVAKKQLKGERITKQEYTELHYIGGTIEYILFALLETDHLPKREKSMALIADVYLYNSTNLNVAVGHADDIYTIVPINGEYHIARGSIFSYYEFRGKIHTDEQWRARIRGGDIPERPEWIKPIINNAKSLEGQMQYRY